MLFLYSNGTLILLSVSGGDLDFEYEVKSVSELNYCNADCSMYYQLTYFEITITDCECSVADWDSLPVGQEPVDMCDQGVINGNGQLSLNSDIHLFIFFTFSLPSFDI